MIHLDRMDAANRALQAFPIGRKFSFEVKSGRVAICWVETWNKVSKRVCKVWQHGSKGSHFPTFDVPTGGTMTGCLSMLVRWIRGENVMPLRVFKWWDEPQYAMFRNDDGTSSGAKVMDILREAGYPETSKCMICGEEPKGLDWWNDKKKAGPCCSYGRCEVVPKKPEPQTTKAFLRVATSRGVPCARIGMMVEMNGRRGLIVDHNESANFEVYFFDTKQVGNCHPNWRMTYFREDGSVLLKFDE